MRITDYSIVGEQIIDLSAYTLTGSYAKKTGIYDIVDKAKSDSKSYVVSVNGKIYKISNADIVKSGSNYVITLPSFISSGNLAKYVITVTNADNAKIETVTASGGETYVLPAATASTLGGIKVGSGLSVEEDGTLSATGGSTPTEHTLFANWNGSASRFELDTEDTSSASQDITNYSVGDIVKIRLRTTEEHNVDSLYGVVLMVSSNYIKIATQNIDNTGATIGPDDHYVTLGPTIYFVDMGSDLTYGFYTYIKPKVLT